jgi:enamine deaminase RidA (YjgF/YER057c/UK114 family)
METQTQEATQALDMTLQELGDKRPSVTESDVLTRPLKKTKKISTAWGVDLAE